jgi:hypothetical protein
VPTGVKLGVELTPLNASRDFGPESAITADVLLQLWEHLNDSLALGNNRVVMLFSEWQSLFQQSTSLGRIGQSKLGDYVETFGIPRDADPTKVLFVLHTYHALFFKILAAEIVLANTVLPGTPQDYSFRAAAAPDDELLRSLKDEIEDSALFRSANLSNFVEGSFFSWYLENTPEPLLQAIRAVVKQISLYQLTSLRLDRTRDIVKHLYQQLVPRVLRKNIGEFFTPEWMVEFVLDRVGYRGPDILTRRFLDPCCGSGNFLLHVIERYKAEARAQGWTDEKILRGILNHIFGFDLNPLAVLTARVNYLIAISDLLATHTEVEIPVYQADAVYSPTLADGVPGTDPIRRYKIDTQKETLEIELPESLIRESDVFARVLQRMEHAIREKDTENVYLAQLEHEPGFVDADHRAVWERYLADMFQKVTRLEEQNWNHIWCRIIRNYFASVAIGECHYVAGNPPWVRWSELPETYRERIKKTCEAYNIFSKDRFFGGNELDISGMITYTVADKWLARRGRLAFVITQTHFQSQSSGGFRRFRLEGSHLKVERVDDFSDVKAFKGVANKPAVLTLVKGRRNTFPIPYASWQKTTRDSVPEHLDWNAASQQLLAIQMEANPLSGAGRRWSILPPGRFRALQVLDGEDPSIQGRKGIVTDLNGGYFVEVTGRGRRPDLVRVRTTAPNNKKQKSVPRQNRDVELGLVFPLIKGAENIRAFRATVSDSCALIPNSGIRTEEIPPVSQFNANYPEATKFFRAINRDGLLDQRSTWRTRMRPQFNRAVERGDMAQNDVPFFAIYNVGDYTFAPYKVVWAEMSGTIRAAVIGKARVPHGNGTRPVVPDHKVYFAAFTDKHHAHYVNAMLNSAPVREFTDGFTIKLQVGTLFRHIRLPSYDWTDAVHRELARKSREAHVLLARSNGAADISPQQTRIDQLARQVLGIP